jgi:uracil-DNA glycosylase family 4
LTEAGGMGATPGQSMRARELALDPGVPPSSTSGSADPRDELAELAASVRAYVEWQADTGASGLPVSSSPEAILALLADGGARTQSKGLAQARPAPPPAAAIGDASIALSAPPAVTAPLVAAPPAAAPPPTAPPVSAPLAALPTSPDERRTRLALLAEEARSCTKCVLHERRKQAVFARGNPFAELCFVGEGPGADEDDQGEPFVGRAGQLLDRMIAAMGYGRDEVYICNIVKCRPPSNRKPMPEEMTACSPFVTQQLALIRPKVIVALGATAAEGLLGTTVGITRLRGTWKIYKGTIPVMPTFHPAYLLRNEGAKREVWSDLQEVMKRLGKAPPAAKR